MAALQYADVPGYSALMLRRTFRDLMQPSALIAMSHEWLGGTEAQWNDRDKRWTFPEGGTLTFGYLENERDKYQYQGASFQTVCFDEITQFTRTQYQYLLSRLRRREGSTVPLRMRAAGNPGGVGHEWVYSYFVVSGREQGRPFIPAKLADNPYIDQAAYREALARLDPVTRRQLEDGDWSARQSGGMFRREWFKNVEQLPESGVRWCRFWDMAATRMERGKDPDWTVGAKVGLKDGRWIIASVLRIRGTPHEVETLISQTAAVDGKSVPVRIEQEPGSSGKTVIDHYARSVLVGFDFKGIPATGEKATRWRPVSAAAQAGNIDILIAPWNEPFLDEADAAPEGAHDDQLDAVAGAVNELSQRSAFAVYVA